MSASAQPTPAGPPPKWLIPTLGGLVVTLVLSRLVVFDDFLLQERRGVLHVLVHALFVGALVGVLVGLVRAVRWVRLNRLSREFPHQAWLWEFPPKAELVDQQLTTVTRDLLGLAFLAPFLLFFNGAVASLAFAEDVPTAVPLLFGAFILGLDVVIVRKAVIPTFTALLALLRYGRTRLRLSQFPLLPDTETEAELLLPRGREKLSNVRAVLRRVRERRVTRGSGKNKSTETVRDREYMDALRIEAEEQESPDSISFVLKVPAMEPGHSTDLSNSYRCLWELQLTADVPGLDLDVTFLLPVYWVAEELRPSSLGAPAPR
ncbi:hypothetical protein [Hyalangium minutum]|uniref:Uncharacterized protein n=1 Tax=Hyalangium minutum TaxID=394096 RepID=A0A085W8F7_9BACT|nr:hypothetical protein [Hyalangium minutum]KFE63970.1 hypothetical protein DB31_2382 [Hyalangium minutum]